MRYRSAGILVLATAALTALAAEASAQRGHGHARPAYRPRVAFYGGYYYPGFYYGPFGLYSAWWGYPYPYAPPVGDRVGVRLEVKPVETEVYVDGYYAGKVDEFDGFFQRLNVAPGPHVLELYLEGHQMVREELYASPGTSYKIRHEMLPLAAGESLPPRPKPAEKPPEPEGAASVTAERPSEEPQTAPPAPPEFGALVIQTQPDRAEVWIDGQLWPRARPGELVVHLPAGRHVVEVRAEGHRAFSTEVEVGATETTPLNVKLPRSE